MFMNHHAINSISYEHLLLLLSSKHRSKRKLVKFTHIIQQIGEIKTDRFN